MAVTVVNYNTFEHLRKCLYSVEPEAPQEVYVVDNASTDGSLEMVKAEFPGTHVIANQGNPGYGTAANQAIFQTGAKYVLLLNSDTCIQPGTLSNLSGYMERHPHAAVVGPRLVNPDGSLQPSCYSFPTPSHVFLEESSLWRLIGLVPVLDDHYLRTWSHSYSRPVPWVLGAALVIRRDAFLDLGGFDTSFFMGHEEVDFCYRLLAAGWQTHFTPCATIVHFGGASTQQQRSEMLVQFYLSLIQFYKKHYSTRRLWQVNLMMKGIVVLRFLRDSAFLKFETEKSRRAWIVEGLKAWQRIFLYQT